MTGALPGDSAISGGTGPELVTGSKVAGYVIEERLGAGGMAVVYRAVDERLGRRVALKVLAPWLAADTGFRHRFIRESRAAAAADDPHIIPVYEAGEADDVLFIAMRYVPGGDVHSLVRGDGPLRPARAALILSQVASALDAAHRHGLVHRDVKPANMLIDVSADRPDHIYLSDFGLSKVAASASALTGTGMFLGTLDYIAPEQIDGQSVSGQADQYALACSAFELLSGAPPFVNDQPTPMLWAHMSEQPPALTARRPDLPSRVDQVAARALAKSPAERFATCREFTDALREAMGLAPYDSGGRAVPVAARTPTEAAILPPADQPQLTSPRPAAAGPVTVAHHPTVAASVPGHGRHESAGRNAVGKIGPKPRRSPLIFGGICVVAAAAIVAGTLILRSQGSRATGRSEGGAPPTRPPATSRSTATPRVRTFTLLHSVDPPGGPQGVNALAFSSLGKLATAGDSGVVHVWNPGTGRQAEILTAPIPHPVKALAFSPDGMTLAAGDTAGQLDLWDPATQVLRSTIIDPNASQIESAAFSPDGRVLATGDGRGFTCLWDAATGTRIAELPDPNSKGVDTLAFSPDGRTLAAGDYNGTAYLWRVSSRALVSTFPALSASDILSVAFNPEGSILAAGAYNGSTYLWDVTTGKQVAVLTDPGATVAVEALAFNPDGLSLATGDINGNTYLWKLSDDQRIQVLPSPAMVWAVGYSHQGTVLAIADHNGSTFIWHAG